MEEKRPRGNKPRLIYALHMHCCLCGQTPLREPGRYFAFRKGCPDCDYAYDRHEDGYFQGAAWIVNYGILSICLLLVGGLMLRFSGLTAMRVVVLLSAVALVGGLAIHPLCRSLWMWCDHHLHPLGHDESLDE